MIENASVASDTVECEVRSCDQDATCWDDEGRMVCLAHCPDAHYHERSGEQRG